MFKVDKLPVNLFGEVLYQPGNNGIAAEWTAKLNLTLLLPKVSVNTVSDGKSRNPEQVI